MQVTHKFVSMIANDPSAVAAGEVVPSNWNDTHNITGTANSLAGYNSLGASVDVVVGTGLNLSAGGILSSTAAPFLTGTYAAMPAAGTLGRQYFCTDTFSLYFDTGSAWVAITPATGTIQQFAGSLPSGYVACDGTAYQFSGTAYAALYAKIGTTWNNYRGQSTPTTGYFRVPLLNGLSVAAAGAAVTGTSLTQPSTSARTAVTAYGEEAHFQQSTEIYPHAHNYEEQVVGGYVPTRTSGGSSAVGSISSFLAATTIYPSTAQTAFNVIQPTAYVNFGIKL